jgi:predicted DNA-binding ribbon-helix-helix protein
MTIQKVLHRPHSLDDDIVSTGAIVAVTANTSSPRGSGDGMARPRKSQKSLVVKRSIIIPRPALVWKMIFWGALQEISAAQGVRVSELVTTISHGGEHANLSSAIRLFVLDYYRQQAAVGSARR